MAETAVNEQLSDEQLAELLLRCLVLPFHGITLLLPNTVVAEVTELSVATAASHMPEWLLGFVNWRGRNVPLISYERLLGMEEGPRHDQNRMVVCNTLNNNPRMPFIAMVIQGLPHLSVVKHAMLDHEPEEREAEPAVYAYLRLEGETVIVPNIDVIEKMLEHLGVTTG